MKKWEERRERSVLLIRGVNGRDWPSTSRLYMSLQIYRGIARLDVGNATIAELEQKEVSGSAFESSKPSTDFNTDERLKS